MERCRTKFPCDFGVIVGQDFATLVHLPTQSTAPSCLAVWFVALSVKRGRLSVVIPCQEFVLSNQQVKLNSVGEQHVLHCRVNENSVQLDLQLLVGHKYTNQVEQSVNTCWPISHMRMKSCLINLVPMMGHDFLNV